MKLAAVNRCLEVLSDSMGKMPSYAMVRTHREPGLSPGAGASESPAQ